MASGDTVFEKTSLTVTDDDAKGDWNVTSMQNSTSKFVISDYVGGTLRETVFDVTKTYDITIKEH